MEGILIRAMLCQRWTMRLKDEDTVVPVPRITLRPKGGLRMTLQSIREQDAIAEEAKTA